MRPNEDKEKAEKWFHFPKSSVKQICPFCDEELVYVWELEEGEECKGIPSQFFDKIVDKLQRLAKAKAAKAKAAKAAEATK